MILSNEKSSNWGFHPPREELLKVPIDTRPRPINLPQSPTKSARHEYGSPTVLQSLALASGSRDNSKDSAPILEDNQKPLKGPDFMPFGSYNGKGYFGGPILNVLTQKGNPTLYTKSSRKVCVPSNWTEDIPIPPNLETIVRSVGIMGGDSTQSGLWIGPRHFLSTLHFHRWITGKPTKEECDVITRLKMKFNVETEIYSRLLLGSDRRQGSHLIMTEFDTELDIGLFELTDESPNQDVYSSPEWLMERNEAGSSEMRAGQKVGCIGFNSRIEHDDQVKILHQAANMLQNRVSPSSGFLCGFNLDEHVKAEARCLAPGSIDKAEASDNGLLYGGHNAFTDPLFNIISGIPNGLVVKLKMVTKT
ncbi:MAG: hypothetical protein Q9174_003141 [Haloplaca sp. 1 TL-2023]